MDITNVIDVSISDIKLKGANVRSDLSTPNSQEGIKELAENIGINGLLQPIVLRGVQGKPPYDVVVGQRRFLAHQLLGLTTIKATFTGEIADIDSLLLSLSENMCRQEMNYEDISNAITQLYNYYGNDEQQVQKHTGFSMRMIRNYIRIDAQATDKIKFLLRNGSISMADAKRAVDAAQGDQAKADILIDELVKLTKYEKKRLVESGLKNPKANPEELLTEAKKPKLEETLILNLPLRVHAALKNASEKLSLDVEELTMNALVRWLTNNDYLTI